VFTIALGFATSLVYGFADFFGALGSKFIRPVMVTFWSGLSGLALLLTASIFMGATFTPNSILCGVIGGIASAFAMSCLYAALAIGPISILSPLSAVVMAIVPMIIGFAGGDHFSLWGVLALGAILVAVVLVGFVPGEDVRLPSVKGLLLGIGAGIGMGAVLLALAAAPHNSGLAAPAILRAVSASLLGIFMLVTLRNNRTPSHKPKVPTRIWLAVVATGFLDSSANLFSRSRADRAHSRWFRCSRRYTHSAQSSWLAFFSRKNSQKPDGWNRVGTRGFGGACRSLVA